MRRGDLTVRLATSADAEAGCRVLQRSISELCYADHDGDPTSVAAWTANKTPEHWLTWLSQPDTSLFVAVRPEGIVGVGMVNGAGMILLNYVAPEARYEGVSTALLEVMEATISERGIAASWLESTKTAETFYKSRGYEPAKADDPAILLKPLA